jgi:hypothetical protein
MSGGVLVAKSLSSLFFNSLLAREQRNRFGVVGEPP